MKQTPDRTLVSLAYLKTLWDKDRKLLDLYIPFLVELIKRKNISAIEESKVNELSNLLEEEFGLKIPYHPLITLLNRAKRMGFLRREHHKYYIIEECLDKHRPDFEKAGRIINKSVDLLETYAKKHFPTRKIFRKDIESALVEYLARFDYQLVLDPSSVNLPKLKRKDENLFIVGSTIHRIYKEDQDGWQLLQNIIAGHFLSKLILYEENLIQAKYNNLNVYLDTRIIFRLIGGEGVELKAIYRNFVNDLRESGVNLFIFQHTYDEVLGILEGCYQWIDSPFYDESKASLSLIHFKEQGYRQTDIEILRSGLPDELGKLGIKIVETPEIIPQYQIDEENLRNTIIEVYSSNIRFEPLEKEYTLDRDIMSISAIYHLRKGNKPVNLKQAKYIFVTNNTGLAYAVSKFHKKEFSSTGFSIPPCVTDVFLGTLIWINNPPKMGHNISLSALSLSVAISQPSREFLEKWNNEIVKLRDRGIISEEQYILLRDSQIARDLLDERTLGDPDQISSKTAIDILEEIRREGYKEYEKEKESHEKTREELEQMKRKEKEREERQLMRSQKYATGIVWAILLIATVLIILSWIFEWGILSKVLSVVSFILGFLGITFKQIRRFLVKILKRFFEGG